MAISFTFLYNGSTQVFSIEESTISTQSVFLVGLPKAGSTLQNRVMGPIFTNVGLKSFSVQNVLRGMGISPRDYPADLCKIYRQNGYAYIGYRGLRPSDGIPDFASNRTAYLVRDPRDMIVSKYFSEAFSHRPPGSSVDSSMKREFEVRRELLQRTSLEDYVLEYSINILRVFEETDDVLCRVPHRVWRYEDIIFDKLRWVREVVDYLQLDVPERLVNVAVERNDVRPELEKFDQHIRQVSPGDHRRKLQESSIEKLNVLFRPILDKYGYC